MIKKADGALLPLILKSISVPTFVVDQNHVVTHWNTALEKLTGCRAKNMVGTRDHWKAFYSTEKSLLADFVVNRAEDGDFYGQYDKNCRKSNLIDGAYEAEKFFPHLGGEGTWLFLTAAPILDADGDMLGAVQTLQDVTERVKAEEDLRKSESRYRDLSITDSLTKLYNSRHFFHQLRYEVERAKRYSEPLSLILLDIDNFKGYNDTYGHMEGDKALAVLATVIKRNLRVADTAFRYGGEEFTIILPETEGEDAVHMAERLRKDFERTPLLPLSRTEVHMTISVGVARSIPGEEDSVFVKRADSAMYTAKLSGKNRVLLAE